MIEVLEDILFSILMLITLFSLLTITYRILKWLAKNEVKKEMEADRQRHTDKMNAETQDVQRKWNELENAQCEETHRHEHFKLEEKEAYRVFIIQQNEMRRKEKEAEEKIRNVEEFKAEIETKMQLLERQIENLKKELFDARQRAKRLARKGKTEV